MRKALKFLFFLVCFALLAGLSELEICKNEDFPAEESEIIETIETEEIIKDNSECDLFSSEFERKYDLCSENLDVNLLDYSGTKEINSEDEWESYINACLDKNYRYIFFRAPSSLSFNLDKIMKTNQITAITIYSMPAKDENEKITGYNITYTYSHDILAALKSGTAASLDAEMQAALTTAQSFVSALNGSDYDKELAIHNFVCSKITYSSTSDSSSTNCYGGLVLGSGNCQAYSDSFDLLCGLAGITSGRISCMANGVEHSLNYVLLDGQYYFTDCTFDDGISDPERGYGLFYFNLPYSVISQDHSFEYMPFSSSQGLDYNNYYVRNNLYADSPEGLTELYRSLAAKGTTGEILFNSANGDAALTDIFSAYSGSYRNISTQKFTFGSFQILKFTLS